MQAINTLAPVQLGTSNAAPAPVANAHTVPDSTRDETSRPVTGSSQSGANRSGQRGGKVDISV